MASLVGSDNNPVSSVNEENMGSVSRLNQDPAGSGNGNVPKWFGLVCSLCWIVVGAAIAAVVVLIPTLTPNVPDDAATEANTVIEDGQVPEGLDEQVAQATSQITNSLSVEDATALSDEAYEIALQVADCQANMRTYMYDDAEFEKWQNQLKEILIGVPEQAVIWYTPNDDVVFSWDTFQPYVFDVEKVSASEPAVRVLWLARSEDGKVLSWAKALYNGNSKSFSDFERGITSEGAYLMPTNSDTGKTSDEMMIEEIQNTMDALGDFDVALPDAEEVTEESRQAANALRMQKRDENGVTFG